MDGNQIKHPRDETFCDMWTTTFCPNFTCLSFTSMLVLVQVMVYIACLVHSNLLDEGMNDMFFLGVHEETLQSFGMRMPYKVRYDMAVHRLLMPALLNYGISTMVINVLIEMIIGFMVDAPMGSFRMCVFFLISVVGGNLTGCVISSDYAIGAEPFIFAMFSALLGMFIVFWDQLGENVSRKICMMCLVVLFIIIMILFLSSMAD